MNRDLKTLSLSLLTWAMGNGLFCYLVPLHMEALGANAVQIGTLLAAYALVQVVILIPAGVAADRWGTRPVLVTGWVLGTLVTALMASATDLRLFAIGWIGLGASAWVVPALTSYITRARGTLTPERALTLVFAAYSAGMVVSPLLGGLVAERFGTRATFWLATATFVASTVVTWYLRPQAPPPLLRLCSGQAAPGRRYAGLLRNRRFVAFMALVFLAMFALCLGVPLAPNYLHDRWGIAVSGVGLLGSATSVGQVVLGLFLGGRQPRRAFMVLQSAGLLYLLILQNCGQVGWLALGFFLIAGAQISRQFVDAIAARIVSPFQLGLAFAVTPMIFQSANLAASTVAGWLYALRPGLPFQAGVALIPVTLGLTYLFAPQAMSDHALKVDYPPSTSAPT